MNGTSDPRQIAEFVNGIVSRAPPGLIPTADDVARMSDPALFKDRMPGHLSSALDDVGIFSMSDSVAHPLMWAHYANSHKGIALIFRLGASDDSIGAAFPIRYQDEYPRSALKASGFQMHLIFTKGKAWEYEREWRIAEAKRANQWIEIPSASLLGVVLGARASDETWHLIGELAQRRFDVGMPPLLAYRAEIGESFELGFTQFVGNDEWRPVALK